MHCTILLENYFDCRILSTLGAQMNDISLSLRNTPLNGYTKIYMLKSLVNAVSESFQSFTLLLRAYTIFVSRLFHTCASAYVE